MNGPNPAPSTTTFSTVDEVAELLRVSKMTVYRLIHEDEALPAYRIGRSIRVPTKAVWDYVNGNRVMARYDMTEPVQALNVAK